jgi:hypothetical protein
VRFITNASFYSKTDDLVRSFAFCPTTAGSGTCSQRTPHANTGIHTKPSLFTSIDCKQNGIPRLSMQKFSFAHLMRLSLSSRGSHLALRYVKIDSKRLRQVSLSTMKTERLKSGFRVSLAYSMKAGTNSTSPHSLITTACSRILQSCRFASCEAIRIHHRI